MEIGGSTLPPFSATHEAFSKLGKGYQIVASLYKLTVIKAFDEIN